MAWFVSKASFLVSCQVLSCASFVYPSKRLSWSVTLENAIHSVFLSRSVRQIEEGDDPLSLLYTPTLISNRVSLNILRLVVLATSRIYYRIDINRQQIRICRSRLPLIKFYRKCHWISNPYYQQDLLQNYQKPMLDSDRPPSTTTDQGFFRKISNISLRER